MTKEIKKRIAYLEAQINLTKDELEDCDVDLINAQEGLEGMKEDDNWEEQQQLIDCIEMDIDQLESNINSFLLEIEHLRTKL